MPTKLSISPSMVAQLTPGVDTAHRLVDNNLNTSWFPGWNPAAYPAKASIDLQQMHRITKIRLYDGTGSPNFRIHFAVASPTDIIPNKSIQLTLNGYQTWLEIPTDVNARYVIAELIDMQGEQPIGELEVYGDLILTPTPVPTPPPTPTVTIGELIALTSTMVTQLTPAAGTTAKNMVDKDPTTAWFPGWNTAYYPAKAAFDLQKAYQINKIRIYDGAGSPNCKIHFALNSPTEIIANATIQLNLSGYQTWLDITIPNTEARFIVLELMEMQSDKPIGEVEIYGVAVGTTPIPIPTPTPTPTPSPVAKKGAALTVCTNSFPWVPVDLVQPFGASREYQYWEWMEAKEGKNTFEPANGANANFDTHYAALKAKGVKVIPCINITPPWILATYPSALRNKPGAKDFKPVNYGESTTNPLSYRAFARFMFQLAARYGRTQVAATLLTIDPAPRWTNDPINVKKTGLDLLEYIEVWNEPDKWWSDPETKFSPQEYAAMLSACYDGHEGRLGAGHGIKVADPSMKVVMAGLAALDLDYIKGMEAWFAANRNDKKFPAEVLNFHHYSNQNQDLQAIPQDGGVAPEKDDLKQKMATIVAYRDANLAGREVWLSEFGYDTNPISPQSSKAYANFTAEDLQAVWLIRSYLEAIAAGVDKSFMYNIVDENQFPGVPPLFQTSGLAKSENEGFIKKTSWQKVANFINSLDGMTFKGDISTSDNVKMYYFANKTTQKELCYTWSPTDNNSSVEFYNAKTNTVVFSISETPDLLDVRVKQA
jgi:hypothetical protein